MMGNNVTIFKPYPFKLGQKIYIADGPRRGDWEVVDVNKRKIRLRCPFSFKEFEWDRFCYFAEELPDAEWPHEK